MKFYDSSFFNFLYKKNLITDDVELFEKKLNNIFEKLLNKNIFYLDMKPENIVIDTTNKDLFIIDVNPYLCICIDKIYCTSILNIENIENIENIKKLFLFIYKLIFYVTNNKLFKQYLLSLSLEEIKLLKETYKNLNVKFKAEIHMNLIRRYILNNLNIINETMSFQKYVELLESEFNACLDIIPTVSIDTREQNKSTLIINFINLSQDSNETVIILQEPLETVLLKLQDSNETVIIRQEPLETVLLKPQDSNETVIIRQEPLDTVIIQYRETADFKIMSNFTKINPNPAEVTEFNYQKKYNKYKLKYLNLKIKQNINQQNNPNDYH